MQLLQETKYEVFINYRVAADAELAEKLYYMLGHAGLSVFLDKHCLVDGVSWRDGFIFGLRNSDLFVAIMSPGALARMTTLTETSPCDNVLLEYLVSLELMRRGVFKWGIYPLLLGGQISIPGVGKVYVNPFDSDVSAMTFPRMPDIVVDSVEQQAREQIIKLGLDPSTMETKGMTVKEIVNGVTENQGLLMAGKTDKVEREVVSKVAAIAQRDKPFYVRHPLKTALGALIAVVALVLGLTLGMNESGGDGAAATFTVRSLVDVDRALLPLEVTNIESQVENDLGLTASQVGDCRVGRVLACGGDARRRHGGLIWQGGTLITCSSII